MTFFHGDPAADHECPCVEDEQERCPRHAHLLLPADAAETALDPEAQLEADASGIVDFELGQNAEYWRSRRQDLRCLTHEIRNCTICVPAGAA